MSRKGRMPIPVPSGVEVSASSEEVTVKGPKGQLKQSFVPGMIFEVADGEVLVKIPEGSSMSNFHGLYRSLVNNMIEGVTKGFEKQLELIGVGYRAAVKGANLELQLGFSHPTIKVIPEGITVQVKKNEITVSGIDKQKVGQFAADVRAFRPPEPYKGKGVRYKNEWVRRKAGKAGKK